MYPANGERSLLYTAQSLDLGGQVLGSPNFVGFAEYRLFF